jgi:hypothetical protein
VDSADKARRRALGKFSAPRQSGPKAEEIAEPRAFGERSRGGAAAPDELLLACRRAVETGEAAPAADLFQGQLDRLLIEAFDPGDCAKLTDIRDLADEGLSLAEEGRADPAANRFLAANRIVESGGMESDARTLAEALLWAREGGSEACAGRFEWAVEMLETAIDRDLLCEHAGLEIMLIHRVQIAGERMRLERRRGRLGDALLLGAGLLHYLERPTEPPGASFGPAWRIGWRDHRGVIDPALVMEAHRQIAEQQVSLLRDLEARDAAEAVQQLRRMSYGQPSQAEVWTRFQIARLERHEARLTEAARAILAAGPHPSAPLRRSVAVGVLTGSAG